MDTATAAATPPPASKARGFFDKVAGGLSGLGRAVGGVVNVFYQSGRDTIDTVIKNVLPFIAFIAFLIGVIQATGIGDLIADTWRRWRRSWPGLLLISVIVCLPFLSPVLGPGAVIAQVSAPCSACRSGWGTSRRSTRARAVRDRRPGRLRLHPCRSFAWRGRTRDRRVGVPAVLFSRMSPGLPPSSLPMWPASVSTRKEHSLERK